MALQMDVNAFGGRMVEDCYVRVDSVRAFKKDNMDSWKLMVDVYVYKDKSERDKGNGAEQMVCPNVDRFKFDFDPSGADRLENLVAAAYEKLKTIYPFENKTTDV
jgi:hypothetical protein